MNKGQRLAILVDLLCRLLKAGSWSGETHIQKATFFLQELTGVATDFEFILYKHGPFSFALRDTLTELIADGFIDQVVRNPDYGPSLVPTTDGQSFLERFPKTLSKYSRQLDFVADSVRNKNVGELERLATALFIIRGDLKGAEGAKELVRVKQHISMTDAMTAMREAEQLLEAGGR